MLFSSFPFMFVNADLPALTSHDFNTGKKKKKKNEKNVLDIFIFMKYFLAAYPFF